MSTDRTAEFFSVARSMPGGSSSTSAVPAPPPPAPYAALRSFHQTASGISKDIAATSALLSELTNLVRHQQQSSAVFDGSGGTSDPRVNGLVVRIKQNMENLNARLDQAASTMAQQKRRLGNKSQAGQEAMNVVQGLQTEFAEQAAGFKDILQVRTDSLKASDRWQKQVYGGSNHDDLDDDDDNPIPNLSLAPPPVFGGSNSNLNASNLSHNHTSSPSATAGSVTTNGFPTLDLTSSLMPAGEATGSTPSYLPRPHGISSSASGGGMRQRRAGDASGRYAGAYASFGSDPEAAGSDDNYGTTTPLTPFEMEQMEAQQNGGQAMQLIPDQEYLQQRADAMSTVETNIMELGTIFNKLATMVAEHREMVQRVEDNVEDANANVNLSLNVLTDTLTSLRTNRRLALRVFSALTVFILMFIIFFA